MHYRASKILAGYIFAGAVSIPNIPTTEFS